jgi:hypothetical protein
MFFSFQLSARNLVNLFLLSVPILNQMSRLYIVEERRYLAPRLSCSAFFFDHTVYQILHQPVEVCNRWFRMFYKICSESFPVYNSKNFLYYSHCVKDCCLWTTWFVNKNRLFFNICLLRLAFADFLRVPSALPTAHGVGLGA